MESTAILAGTAAAHGPRWSARAADWAQLNARHAQPAWEAVADATAIGTATRVLDVGCGSGEFAALATARGGVVSGIDAAERMIEIARRAVPEADFRVGAMEDLPWEAGRFDVVTAFNALQFAADPVIALREARRVVRPGALVAICNWGLPRDNELLTIASALRELRPPAPAVPTGPAFGQPGVLEELARRAGLRPVRGDEVDAPFRARDEDTLERAVLAAGGTAPAVEHAGEERVREAIARAALPFRRRDGSYSMENRFRYLVARV